MACHWSRQHDFAAAGGQPRQQPAEDPSIGSETLFRRSRPPQVTSGYRRPSFICGNPSSRSRSLARLQLRVRRSLWKAYRARSSRPVPNSRSSTSPRADGRYARHPQHLIGAIAASAKLMGAECICSGIRPQIAQIIVQLGLDLSVTSKVTMADAFAMALRRVKGPSRIARILPSCNIRLRHVFPDAACGPAQRRAISRLPLQSRRPLQYLSRTSGLSGRAPKLSDQGKNRRSRRAYSLALKKHWRITMVKSQNTIVEDRVRERAYALWENGWSARRPIRRILAAGPIRS